MSSADYPQFKTKIIPAKGRLLLAEPHLSEDFFKRAVILLIEHNSTESFGLVLNHISAIKLPDLFEHIQLNLPIFNGGPVAQNQLFYLHRFKNIQGAAKIRDGLFFGGAWKDVLMQAHLVRNPAKHLRLFAGYAGWGAGQLSSEIKENSWICTNLPKANELFAIKPQELWKHNLLQHGPELAFFANYPVHICDN